MAAVGPVAEPVERSSITSERSSVSASHDRGSQHRRSLGNASLQPPLTGEAEARCPANFEFPRSCLSASVGGHLRQVHGWRRRETSASETRSRRNGGRSKPTARRTHANRTWSFPSGGPIEGGAECRRAVECGLTPNREQQVVIHAAPAAAARRSGPMG